MSLGDDELLASADGVTVPSLACDNDNLLTLGADGAGLECRTVGSLPPTDDGVAGVFGGACSGFGGAGFGGAGFGFSAAGFCSAEDESSLGSS